MREPFDYLDQLKKDYPLDYLDSVQYELDTKVFYYGRQFYKNTDESLGRFFLRYCRKQIADIYRYGKSINISIEKGQSYAISNAYFELDRNLNKSGFKSLSVPWLGVQACNWRQYRLLRNYSDYLSTSTFVELFSDIAIEKYDEVMKTLRTIYAQEEIKFLCVPQDMSCFERMSVKIFKELKKPSFIFLHGLPGRYNRIDDNRTDYLIVWGDKIRELYVNAGIDPKKIFVSGHPIYSQGKIPEIKLKSELENILVIGKSVGGQHSDSIRLQDRGNTLLYLWKIQSVLKQLGVTSVKFRPHPSMNINWYYDFIDKTFFKQDSEKNIGTSLKNSSLVIGPTSSVFFDSLLAGVNYMIFEPVQNGIDMTNFPVVPPFDKSDTRAIVSQTEEELMQALINNSLVDITIISDYVDPEFDINFLHNILS